MTTARRHTSVHRRAIAMLGLTIAVAVSACSSGGAAPVTDADYLSSLETICAATTESLDALPDPPAEITVDQFAIEAASLLDGEAEQIRALEVPDDLDDDHRAFLQNTVDQAAAWREVGTAASEASEDDLLAITTRIGELVLGRNELADEMGAPGCRRGGL